MKGIKTTLTEERRQILFKQLNQGIGIASYADGTYAGIDLIESAIVELWESGVTDTEIQQSIKNRNFSKCYDAIASAQDVYKQRDKFGINSKDAERLKMLLEQLANPSYASYLSFRKAEEAVKQSEIKAIETKWAIQKAQERAQEYFGTTPILLEHPIINLRNVNSIFGNIVSRIYYENENNEIKAIFQIYCDKLEDFQELKNRFDGKEITYTIKIGLWTKNFFF